MIVCLCEAVSDRTVVRAIERGCRTVGELAEQCGAGSDCGSCCTDLVRLLRERRARPRNALDRPATACEPLAAK